MTSVDSGMGRRVKRDVRAGDAMDAISRTRLGNWKDGHSRARWGIRASRLDGFLRPLMTEFGKATSLPLLTLNSPKETIARVKVERRAQMAGIIVP